MSADDLAPEVWLIRGEGGAVQPMQLPLAEGITSRLRSGALLRVNEDGDVWEAPPIEAPPATVADLRIERELAETAAFPPAVEKPDPSARKGEWVTFAATQGITREAAEDLTKAELVARFG